VTQERLKDELGMRRTELEKIDTLEDKIKNELVQLADKSEQLKKNIETYTHVSMQAAANDNCSGCCCLAATVRTSWLIKTSLLSG
jgi:phage shock protein A